jgi:hypothetical protein
MFGFNNDSAIDEVFNPLKISRISYVEFNIGKLKDTGIYKFEKIIEMNVEQRPFARYLIYSKSEDTEYILEVFRNSNGNLETYLYDMVDTIPFDEDFFNNVAGHKYLTLPDGAEYERITMPFEEDRIDGVSGKIKIYDIESDRIEKEVGIKVWDYTRTVDGKDEHLNMEMMEDTGMFRIFVGEIVEEIFYKVYQGK